MKISMSNEGLHKLKTAVDSGLRITFTTSTTLEDQVEYPVIVYFGDVPISATPKIKISLNYFEDNEGNGCAVFCGVVYEDDGLWFPIETFVPLRLVSLFIRDWVVVTFCNKIKEIKDDEIVCEKERTLIMYNSLDKNIIYQIAEKMKSMKGDEKKAWQKYLETYKYPICLSSQELAQLESEDVFFN